MKAIKWRVWGDVQWLEFCAKQDGGESETEERSRLEIISGKLFSDQYNNGDQWQELHAIFSFLTWLCSLWGWTECLLNIFYLYFYFIFFEYFFLMIYYWNEQTISKFCLDSRKAKMLLYEKK